MRRRTVTHKGSGGGNATEVVGERHPFDSDIVDPPERALDRDKDSEKLDHANPAEKGSTVVGDLIMDWTTIGSHRSARKGLKSRW